MLNRQLYIPQSLDWNLCNFLKVECIHPKRSFFALLCVCVYSPPSSIHWIFFTVFLCLVLAGCYGEILLNFVCIHSQVGLDGIRMLDPNSSCTLRIYPLETVTRCDVSWLNLEVSFCLYFVVLYGLTCVLCFFFNFLCRNMIHLRLHSGQRPLWTLSLDVLDCSQIAILQIHF